MKSLRLTAHTWIMLEISHDSSRILPLLNGNLDTKQNGDPCFSNACRKLSTTFIYKSKYVNKTVVYEL